uniref:Uncharacterized protein n=1 Tax=Micrurus corallinus TaxID=54390 RepID=A0A2D4GGH6_MICCO
MNLKIITGDYKQLGKKIKELGAQVFSFISPRKGQHPMREQRILKMNYQLKNWCLQVNFSFLGYDLHYLHEGLLARMGCTSQELEGIYLENDWLILSEGL